jgi:hypothetical protein
MLEISWKRPSAICVELIMNATKSLSFPASRLPCAAFNKSIYFSRGWFSHWPSLSRVVFVSLLLLGISFGQAAQTPAAFQRPRITAPPRPPYNPPPILRQPISTLAPQVPQQFLLPTAVSPLRRAQEQPSQNANLPHLMDTRLPNATGSLNASPWRNATERAQASERTAQFQETHRDCEFYFPNDLERRYRWVKVSATTARNMVNGRTAQLPVGTPVIVVPRVMTFGGLPGGMPAPEQAAGSSSSTLRNTLHVNNPNEYAAKVSLQSGSQNSSLNVAAHNRASVQLADGTYQVFFEFSDRPGRRFQGDDVSLYGNVAEIKLVSVVDGNYGLREVN